MWRSHLEPSLEPFSSTAAPHRVLTFSADDLGTTPSMLMQVAVPHGLWPGDAMDIAVGDNQHFTIIVP